MDKTTAKEIINNLKNDRTIKYFLRDLPKNADKDMSEIYLKFFEGAHPWEARCFADLFENKLKQTITHSITTFPLVFRRDYNWFDYDKLFDELNEIFGGVFRIVRYYSGIRYVRFIAFITNDNIKNKAIIWMGLYMAFSMLRMININFFYDWKIRIFDNNKVKSPLNNWEDVLTLSANFSYKYQLCTGIYGTTKKTARAFVKEFLKTMKTMFGTNLASNYNSVERIYPAQSEVYRIVRRFIAKKGK